MNHIMGSLMEGWHLSKSVSITHILTTLTAVIAVLLFMTDIDKRVEVNSVKISQVTANDQVIKTEVRNLGETIVNKLDAMETRQYEHLQQHMNDSRELLNNHAQKFQNN